MFSNCFIFDAVVIKTKRLTMLQARLLPTEIGKEPFLHCRWTLSFIRSTWMFWTRVTCQTKNTWYNKTTIFAGVFTFYTSFIQFTFPFIWSQWMLSTRMTCQAKNTWYFVTTIFTTKFSHSISPFLKPTLIIFLLPYFKIPKNRASLRQGMPLSQNLSACLCSLHWL